MGLWKGSKKFVGHMVDVRVDRWIDLASLKNSSLYFWERIKNLFSIQVAEHPESFEEAIDRMALSPETVTKQSERFLKLSLFFVLMAMALLIYTIVLSHLKNWTGMGICISLSLYALSLAFRFHFWHFQISQKKLGCNVWEWCRLILPQKRKNQL
ncbi:MAG TPA: type IVB secretion system protein IcmV [Gammaproteobacteria bacterium]|nr:type IVB secretion system protein IcmV [Gammaproteobacteria bacterium]